MPGEEKEKLSVEEKAREARRKVVMGGVAVVTSLSVLVGGLFHSPEALLAEEQPLEPVAVVQNDDDDLDGPGGDGDKPVEDAGKETEQEEEEERAREGVGVRAGLRQKILQLPYAVRLLVILPLWALGFGIITLATALWSGVLSPVLGKLLGWVLLLAAMAAAFVLAAKTVFPDLKVKDLLKKRNLFGLLIAAGLLALADIVLPLFWADYPRIEAIVRAVGIFLILGLSVGSFCLKEHKRRKALPDPAPEPEPEEDEEPRPLTREDILAIADHARRG